MAKMVYRYRKGKVNDNKTCLNRKYLWVYSIMASVGSLNVVNEYRRTEYIMKGETVQIQTSIFKFNEDPGLHINCSLDCTAY